MPVRSLHSRALNDEYYFEAYVTASELQSLLSTLDSDGVVRNDSRYANPCDLVLLCCCIRLPSCSGAGEPAWHSKARSQWRYVSADGGGHRSVPDAGDSKLS